MGGVRSQRPQPRGYVGRNHETIGSDLLAVLRSLQHLVGEDAGPKRLPKQILGPDEAARLEALDPNGWYPIGWLLDLMDQLDAKLGRFGLLKMGRTLFKLSHEAHVKTVAKSGWDVVHSFDELYHRANRGDGIGGWRVLSFTDQRAELEKTTPHHCAMEEGILMQALAAVGAPSVVSQDLCLRAGADACRFLILPAAGGHWR